MSRKSRLGLLVILFWVPLLVLAAAAGGKKPASAKPATAPALVWSPAVDCATCHPTEVKSTLGTALLAATHTALGKACVDCHEAPVLQDAHKAVTLASKAPAAKHYPQQFCLKCHGSYADLIARTRASNIFTDIDKKAINPHQTHKGQLDCHVCHSAHKTALAIDYCYGCHHVQLLSNCHQCHK